MSLTVSLIAVLIPLLFMGDIVGRLFREFAVTLAVTILVSAVVSLTLTPMMCARLLRHSARARAGPAVSCVRACSSNGSIEGYGTYAAMGAAASDATLLVFVARSRRRSCSTSSCRRDSSRFRIPA